jgi:hypothetical protein
VACEFFPPLIDKDTMVVRGLWLRAVPGDIELEKARGFNLELYEPEAIPFAQDGQRFVVGIEVVEIERCDFRGPGP